MFNKYLLIAVGLLGFGCLFLYNALDKTKMELADMKAQKITLEQELKRRDENEKNLSKRISELSELYAEHSDYFNSRVPDDLSKRLHDTCKSCK